MNGFAAANVQDYFQICTQAVKTWNQRRKKMKENRDNERK